MDQAFGPADRLAPLYAYQVFWNESHVHNYEVVRDQNILSWLEWIYEVALFTSCLSLFSSWNICFVLIYECG